MEWSRLLLSLFVGIWFPHQCQSQERFAGPYRVVPYQTGICDDPGTNQTYYSSTRINRVGRNKYMYSTNVTTEVVIDDNVSVSFDIANWGNGGWRLHFMQLEFPKACSTLKNTFPSMYKILAERMHTECPIAPGTYEIKEIDLGDVINAPEMMPSYPYSKYRLDMQGTINGTVVGCLRWFLDVVPEKRSRPHNKPKNH